MDNKTCTVCNIEKHINNFYKIYSESKACIIKRGVKRNFDNKDKISIQQKIYYKKMEMNCHRNKMITETKETRILET